MFDNAAHSSKIQKPRPSAPGLPFPPIERKACHTTDCFINHYCLETRTLPKLGQVVFSPARNWWESKSESLEMFFDSTLFHRQIFHNASPSSFILTQPPRRGSRITVEREQKHLKVSFTLMTMTKMAMDVVGNGERERAPRILCSPRNSLPFLPPHLLDAT